MSLCSGMQKSRLFMYFRIGSGNIPFTGRTLVRFPMSRGTSRFAVLAIATNWVTGCATVGFEGGGGAACPQVVEYSREFQARAAERLALLPGGSAIVALMGDARGIGRS